MVGGVSFNDNPVRVWSRNQTPHPSHPPIFAGFDKTDLHKRGRVLIAHGKAFGMSNLQTSSVLDKPAETSGVVGTRHAASQAV